MSTDVKVISAVTTILADTTERKDFEEVADFLLLAAPMSVTDENMSHNISALSEDDATGFEICKKGKTGIEMRYYPHPEYIALSKEQKDELYLWNEANRKKHPNLKKKRKRANISALRTELKELKEFKERHEANATIAAADSTTATPPTNNRTNPALQRVTRPPT